MRCHTGTSAGPVRFAGRGLVVGGGGIAGGGYAPGLGGLLRNAVIIGTGSYVPPEVITNDDLVARFGVDTDDAWIRSRTGVQARRFAAEGVGTAALGAEAARRALDAAGLQPWDVDLIVAATLSPDRAFPGIGVQIQELLGIPDDVRGSFTPCLDVRNQCSGFLYALSHAVAVVRAGMAERVLVVGAEVHSSALDLTTRGRAVASLFGDGAGAVVVAASDGDAGFRDIVLGADGRYVEALCQDVWNIGNKPFIARDGEGNGVIPPAQMYAHMNGPLVFKHAVQRMMDALHQVCAASSTELADVDLFLFHQANLRINTQVQQLLEIPEHKVLHNIQRYGNTTAATIPLLLDEAVRTGRLEAGHKVAMVAFGSGFTWGAARLDW